MTSLPHVPSATGQAAQSPSAARTVDVQQMMGLVGQRRQLVAEIEDLQRRRLEIAGQQDRAAGSQKQLLQRSAAEVERQMSGAQAALQGIDAAIAAQSGQPVTVSSALAPAIAEVTTQAGVPEVIRIDGSAMVMGAGILGVVALSWVAMVMSIRRLRREVHQLHAEVSGELRKVSLGVETMAVEIERVGEGQRFVTKALSEKGAAGR